MPIAVQNTPRTFERPLTGKTALVTGAPRSIGRAAAEALAALGANIAVHFRSRQDEADATVADLRAAGANAVALGADLSDPAQITALFDKVEREFGGLDIVVANAGVTSPPAPLAQMTDEEFDRVFAVNTRSVFFVLREAARRLRDGGRIINVGSSSAHFALEGFSVYAGSKTAPLTAVRILAKELGPRQITANTVVVGPIADGFLAADSDFMRGAPDGMLDQLAAAAPAKRLGAPGDIGSVIAFLATSQASWVNGQEILVNGGASV